MIDPRHPLESFAGLAVLGLTAGVILLVWQWLSRLAL